MKKLLFLTFILSLVACDKSSVAQIENSIELTTSSLTYENNITSLPLNFECSSDWKITTTDNWITIDPSSGNASVKTATISAEIYSETADRTTTLNIICGDISKEISIIQKGVIENIQRKDGDVEIIKESSKAIPFNIVVLGDGFTKEDNVKGGSFEKEADKILEFLFSASPFENYKEYYNVYYVYAHSKESGADMSPGKNTKNTAFNSTFGYGGIDRLLVVQNTAKLNLYVKKATQKPNLKIVVVNSNKYGGSGGGMAVASTNSMSNLIALHEIGHVFTLGDEYADEQYRKTYNITLEMAKKVPNVDITNDLKEIKWKHFIGLEGYEAEGAYEGGYYFEKGVWRPQSGGMMRNYKPASFNAISRETIAKIIIKNAGEEYNFEEFLKKDKSHHISKSLSLSPIELDAFPMPVPLEYYYKKAK
ncbi:MAG: hypothetical protein IMY73_05015 [Bacteroidetes bacterium]|nr:hypothetical protein [Bacteroidota bacterium]